MIRLISWARLSTDFIGFEPIDNGMMITLTKALEQDETLLLSGRLDLRGGYGLSVLDEARTIQESTS